MIPFLVVGTAGLAIYKYYSDENEKEDSKKKDKKEANEKIKSRIETLPFFVAASYSMANIDGKISKEEEKAIEKYEAKIKKLMPDEDKSKYTHILNEIKTRKNNIKFSDAIQYIKNEYEKFVKNEIATAMEDIVWADGKRVPLEIELLKRINIFLEKGISARDEIIELENNDNLPNYYLTDNKEFKSKILSTKIITRSEGKEFINIAELQNNNYYVVHPMNEKMLFDIKNIDRIETSIIAEWHSLATKLGAKSFSCIVETEQTLHENDKVDINGNLQTIATEGNYKQNNSTIDNNHESKFTQYNFESEGEKCERSKEDLIDSMLWLKNNKLAINLIDAMTSKNKHKKFEIESSLKQFSDCNKQFNLTAYLSLLARIDSKLKIDIEKSITKKSHYKQKIIITF